MKLSTRSRIAIAAAVLSGGALLAPAAPATAGGIPQCTPDNCDSLIYYYSDATRTTLVGQYEDGPCGYVQWGQVTEYARSYRVTC